MKNEKKLLCMIWWVVAARSVIFVKWHRIEKVFGRGLSVLTFRLNIWIHLGSGTVFKFYFSFFHLFNLKEKKKCSFLHFWLVDVKKDDGCVPAIHKWDWYSNYSTNAIFFLFGVWRRWNFIYIWSGRETEILLKCIYLWIAIRYHSINFHINENVIRM